MCGFCGCNNPDETNFRLRKPSDEKNENIHEHHYHHNHQHSHDNDDHSHNHDHNFNHSHTHDHVNHSHNDEHHDHINDHNHDHQHPNQREINIEKNILYKNDLLAERNRGYFEAKNIFTINLVSSPGSGKTSLLEKTIQNEKFNKNIFVIEGDQQTMNDANRINNAGAPVIQINTGNGCHLDSEMISKAVRELNPTENSLLVIENVGNLVCPSMFDLGENIRVVMISTTEGEDKPLKYPNMFQSSQVCIINKIDLLPYVDFNVENTKKFALSINPNLKFIELSVKTEEGISAWIDLLSSSIQK